MRESLPRAKIEVRIDSAFFNQGIVERLHSLGVTFTVSVPIERFAGTEGDGRTQTTMATHGGRARILRESLEAEVVEYSLSLPLHQKTRPSQNKFPIQLDLFQPIEYGYEFKVVVTNKRINPRKVVLFHEGRGSQEGIFAELKTHCQMGYVPVKTRVGNQLYMFAGILAHTSLASFRCGSIRASVVRPRTRRPVVLSRGRDPSPYPHSTRRAHHSPRWQADSV